MRWSEKLTAELAEINWRLNDVNNTIGPAPKSDDPARGACDQLYNRREQLLVKQPALKGQIEIATRRENWGASGSTEEQERRERERSEQIQGVVNSIKDSA